MTDSRLFSTLPLLLRCDEVKSGNINHALCITLRNTKDQYAGPATHWAVSGNSAMGATPMGCGFV